MLSVRYFKSIFYGVFTNLSLNVNNSQAFDKNHQLKNFFRERTFIIIFLSSVRFIDTQTLGQNCNSRHLRSWDKDLLYWGNASLQTFVTIFFRTIFSRLIAAHISATCSDVLSFMGPSMPHAIVNSSSMTDVASFVTNHASKIR